MLVADDFQLLERYTNFDLVLSVVEIIFVPNKLCEAEAVTVSFISQSYAHIAGGDLRAQ
jgi:hypothetical protein